MSERMRELIEEPRVAPSILSADFAQARLAGRRGDGGRGAGDPRRRDGRPLRPADHDRARWSPASIADQVHAAGGAIDVHLMIEAPERHIEAFAEAGADSITFHVEATPHANRTLAAIRELGCLAGIAINPGTPVEALAELRDRADIVLCMTVNPGWGGQAFIEGSHDKVARLAALVGDGRRSRSTAASTPPPRARSPRPAHRCSSPARPSSAPPIRPRPTRRSPPPPARPEAGAVQQGQLPGLTRLALLTLAIGLLLVAGTAGYALTEARLGRLRLHLGARHRRHGRLDSRAGKHRRADRQDRADRVRRGYALLRPGDRRPSSSSPVTCPACWMKGGP